jgi:hypothetical protein
MNKNVPGWDCEGNLNGRLQRQSTQSSTISAKHAYRETLSNSLEQIPKKQGKQGHTDRLVSLYLTLMSTAVRRMASIASSSVTE